MRFSFIIWFILIGQCFSQEKITISLEKKLPSSKVYDIEKLHNKIFFFTPKGITVFNGKDFTTYNSKNGLKNDDVFNGYADTKGRVWLYTKSKKIPYLLDKKINYLEYELEELYYWLKEANNKLLVCYLNKVLQFDIETLTLTDSLSYNSTIIGIDSNNRVLTYDGYFDLNGKALKAFDSKIDSNGFILTHKISNYSDFFNPVKNTLYRYTFDKIDSIHFNEEVLSVEFQPLLDKFLVSGENRFYLENHDNSTSNLYDDYLSQISHTKNIELYPDNNQNTFITNVSNEVKLFPYYSKYINQTKLDFLNQDISCFAPMQNGFLIGTEAGKILYYNSLTNSASVIHHLKDGIRSFYVHNNHFYIQGNENIYEINTENYNQLNVFQKNFTPKSFVTSDYNLYAFGFLGILEINNSQEKVYTPIDKFHPITGVKIDDTTFLLSDKNKVIRYSSASKKTEDYSHNGVFKLLNFQGHLNLITNYYILRGNDIENLKDTLFFNERIHDVLSTKNHLFIGTDKGLYIIDSNYKKQLILDEKRGLINDQILDIKIRNNSIYVLTKNTIITIDNQLLNHQLNKPEVTAISINTEGLKSQGLFSSFFRKLKVEVEANSYIDPSGFDLYYRIPSINKKWTLVNSDNFEIELENPVNDFLEVKIESFNIESNIKRIPIIIEPAFLETWFAKILFLLIGLMILIIVNIIIVRRVIQKKKERQVLENKLLFTEIENLQARMNPHFLYNSLDSFQSLFFYKGKIEANEFLGDFAKLLRKFLEYTKLSLVSISNEVDLIENYLKVESKRFSEKFDYEIKVNLAPEKYQIPTLLVQPTVENAILHGISNVNEKGKIEVIFSLSEDEKHIIIQIIDNGIGIEEATRRKNIKSSHTSLALTMIEDKIKTIKIITHQDIDFTIVDRNKTGERGTISTFKIPTDLWKNWQS